MKINTFKKFSVITLARTLSLITNFILRKENFYYDNTKNRTRSMGLGQ